MTMTYDPNADLATPRTVVLRDPDSLAWAEFARQTIRPPAYVYRRRRLAILLIVGALILIGCGIHDGVIRSEAPPTSSPDILDSPPLHGKIGAGMTSIAYMRPPPGPRTMSYEVCEEDDLLVPSDFGDPATHYVCVNLDDFADPASIDRLDAILTTLDTPEGR